MTGEILPRVITMVDTSLYPNFRTFKLGSEGLYPIHGKLLRRKLT